MGGLRQMLESQQGDAAEFKDKEQGVKEPHRVNYRECRFQTYIQDL